MKHNRLYLFHMLERSQRIAKFIEPGKEIFMASEQNQDAVIRNIEVIGEAANATFASASRPISLSKAARLTVLACSCVSV